MESSLHDKPLVWYSQTGSPESQSDCNCDCQPACSPYGDVAFNSKLVPNLASFDCEYILQQELVFVRLGKYLLVSNPTGSGRIVVLNKEAIELLNLFRYPVKIENLLAETKIGLSGLSIRKLANLFLSLGFLKRANEKNEVVFLPNSEVLTIWLHVTNNCNLSCSYCFVEKSSENINLNVAKQVVAQVIHSAKINQFKRIRLKYAGGEPTIKIRDVFSIHDYAVEQANNENIEIEAILLSNGVHISDWTIDELKRRNISVMISLDGVGVMHDVQRKFINGMGSFERVVRTLEKLKNKDIVPHISVTVTNRNMAGLPDLVKYLLKKSLPFSLNYYRNPGTKLNDLSLDVDETIRTMRNVFKLIEDCLPKENLLGRLLDRANLSNVHKYTCGSGINYIAISHKGFLARCQMDVSKPIVNGGNRDIIGLLKNDSQRTNYPVDEKETCQTCTWRYWCTGGCPITSYNTYGRFDISSPNCSIYASLMPEVLRLEGLRLLKHTIPWSPY